MEVLMPGGLMGRMCVVDLSEGTVETRETTESMARLYMGGRGLGVRLLYDGTPAGMDPYDPDMLLIFSTGPLTGTAAPQSNRFVVTTKSPLTGGLADSHCGGDFATKLKKAGYDALVVKGASDRPVYIEVTEDGARIKDATHLWGLGTEQAQQALPKEFGKAVIGPAGENRVRFACIVSGHRVAGRGGVGAVMGAKKLKAVIANGRRKVEVAHPERYAELKKSFSRFLLDHPMTGGILPELGTANLVMTTAGRNILPNRNFQRGSDPRAIDISGEYMRDNLLVKRTGCLSCPVRCGRHVKAGGREGKGPEFETIGLVGSNLGIFDLESIVELGRLCDDLGLDSISCGGVLGFATELVEKGFLKAELKWGDAAGYRSAIEDIASRRGLGDELAEGVKRLSERYGGEEFAIHVKGLELPAYDPRGCYGQGLEYATNNRGGCHIRGSTMYLEATGPLSVNPHSVRAKPELVVLQQNTNAAVSSLVMCYFSAYSTLPAAVFKLDPNSALYGLITCAFEFSGPVLRLALRSRSKMKVMWYEKLVSAVTGYDLGMGQLNELGERVFNLERMYNLREGFDRKQDRLPRRLLDEPTFPRQAAGVPLGKMLGRYYEIRGWDEQGRPKPETLLRLQIRA
ncbi:MAG: aldehyde:ferredoxin oxidoreductase [Deltaproteobacteria bacterium]|nr:MAG: aldehyde:ferredoxin oxidoreductase [Deltaproteobacteria bacterium]